MRVAVLVIAAVFSAGALDVPLQAQQGAAQPANAPDVKALVFELANSMGMLRGMQQEDSIVTLEQWATGTVTTGQQRSEISAYRMSVNYAVPGMRVDFAAKAGDSQARRSIQVVSGAVSWDEGERGKSVTPMPSALKDRLVLLWTTPMGVVKAARLAGPNAKITTAGGVTTLSFPLPAPVQDVVVNATVRKDQGLVTAHPTALKDLVGTYITRVQTAGAVVADITYAEYGDWNWDDYKSDVMLPRRTVLKAFGQVLELTTKNTNTYNPYVVMPVPDNMRQAASR